MNTRFRDRSLFLFGYRHGAGSIDRVSPGIIATAGMPLVCLTPGTRNAAFRSTLGYYVAAIWPMVPGLDRYLGQSAVALLPIAMWVLSAILLSLPWAIAWTSDRRFDYLWRVPLALLATIVPPLGIIGLASPLTAAGYLFPGTAWFGLAAVALLPGIVLSTHALSLRRRCAVLCLFSVSAVVLAIGGRLFARGDAAPPAGWIAVNTRFGDVSQSFQDFPAAQFIQQKANETSAPCPYLSRVRRSPVVGINGGVLATIARSLPNARPNSGDRCWATGQDPSRKKRPGRIARFESIRLRCRHRRS